MKFQNKLLVFAIAFCLIFSISTSSVLAAEVATVTLEDVQEAINMTLDYYESREQINLDWEAFAINAVGEDVQVYGTGEETYLTLLEEKINTSGVGGLMTDYERTTLGILSAGGDPTDFAGIDLIDEIVNWPDLSQGINAAIFGLIALDAANAIVPDGAKHTRETFIQYILDNTSGDGWRYGGGNTPDPDMTSMALYALAPYKDRQDVRIAGEKAIQWLSENQLSTGGYISWGTINSESCAQVICALTSWEVNPQGLDFTKEDGNVVTALLDFQIKDGSDKGLFAHVEAYGADPGFATQQALYALGAFKEYLNNGKSTIFYKIIYSGSGTEVSVLEIYPDRLVMDKEKYFELGIRNQANKYISNDEVIWSSSNTEVATIDENGVLHTVDSGVTTIVAKLKDNESIRDMIQISVHDEEFNIEKIENGIDAEMNMFIEARVTNVSDELKDAVCILGLYDEDTNKLIDMNYISKSFLPQQIHTVKASFDVSDGGNYKIKVLVWDDWNQGRALGEALIAID